MPKHDVSISELRRLISYDPETGELRRLVTMGNRAAGQITGSVEPKGYLKVSVGKLRMKAHVIAWAIHYGQWPELQIDHINNNPADNRIENLRLATNQQNCANKGLYRNNTSGIKGVSLRSNGKWQAGIKVNYVRIHLGSFNTKEAAAEAYRQAAEATFGQFANPTLEERS